MSRIYDSVIEPAEQADGPAASRWQNGLSVKLEMVKL
ncbi:hypothetical protein HALA3H3_710080 [Halomonas sp. A3H3]|nr:hypothetical protein HALA3H3_710080 [Halomonas sp. A3H3]